MITYQLSNRQRKELLVRAVPLLIVLPAPVDDPADWLDFARDSLPDEAEYVASAAPATVRVCPAIGSGGLTGVIGSLTPSDADLAWLVEVVEVRLDPPAKSRHPIAGPQWPGAAITEYGVVPR